MVANNQTIAGPVVTRERFAADGLEYDSLSPRPSTGQQCNQCHKHVKIPLKSIIRIYVMCNYYFTSLHI